MTETTNPEDEYWISSYIYSNVTRETQMCSMCSRSNLKPFESAVCTEKNDLYKAVSSEQNTDMHVNRKIYAYRSWERGKLCDVLQTRYTDIFQCKQSSRIFDKTPSCFSDNKSKSNSSNTRTLKCVMNVSEQSVSPAPETRNLSHLEQLDPVPLMGNKSSIAKVCRCFRQQSSCLHDLALMLAVIWALVTPALTQDLRCFNMAGGPVENFFVRESLPVGSVLGILQLEGDPGPEGDIFLSLDSQNYPVSIQPFSKNLTLVSALDKEGKVGVMHVLVYVNCKKRNTTDPNIKIPVNIRVTDDNDNAPVFVNSPYYVNVSEMTVVGTVIMGDILAVDQDQPGPFSTVQYSILPGPFSDVFTFQSPLRGALVLKKPLDYEQHPFFNITIVAKDQGSSPMSSRTLLTVQVADADDQNPSFLKQRYMAVLQQNPTEGSLLEIQPELMQAIDKDIGINAEVTYSFAGGEDDLQWFSIDHKSGLIRLVKDLPQRALSQPSTLLIQATQLDNPDRQGVTTLTVSRRGYISTQLQFVQREYMANVLESLPINSIITHTLINKKIEQDITFSLERDGDGMFRISSSGQVLLDYQLDYEMQQEYSLKVYVTDGEFNDTAHLLVRVLNVNDWDPRFRYQQYEFYVTGTDTLSPGDVIGDVEIADGDLSDRIQLTVMGKDARLFKITNDGQLRIRDLTGLNTTEAHIIIMARDSLDPPRSASVPVVVKFQDRIVASRPIGLNDSFLLLVIFGSLLMVFIIVIICLAIYIYKNKKYRGGSEASLSGKMNHVISPSNNRLVDPTLTQSLKGLRSSSPSTLKSGYLSPMGAMLPPPPGLAGVEEPTRWDSNSGIHPVTVRTSNISVRSSDSNNGSGRYQKNTSGSGGLYASISPNRHKYQAEDTNSYDGTLKSSYSSANSVSTLEASQLPSKSPFGSARAMGGSQRSKHVVPSSKPRRVVSPPTTPAPPPPPSNTPYPDPESDGRSDGVFERRVAWPTGSMPRKVKKLSWEDELSSRTELDPEVSLTPMEQDSTTDIPNLTVYF